LSISYNFTVVSIFIIQNSADKYPPKLSHNKVKMSDLVADRLAEAAQIESEWNAMSYKDRAAWWMSAKWYGYMSAEAYRRGDPLNSEISNRCTKFRF
jgi:hypothetical protein